MGEGVRLTKLLPLLLVGLLLLAPEGGQGRKVRGGRGREESRGGIQGGLAELLGGLLPNTYYSRPNYRYPYYDKTGKVTSPSAVISHVMKLFFFHGIFDCVIFTFKTGPSLIHTWTEG